MKKRRRMGMGRVFQRPSRITGKMLPNWYIGYRVPGEPRERREPAETTVYAEAVALLRKRQGEIAAGKLKRAGAEQRTVSELLELVRKHREDNSKFLAPGHLEALNFELGRLRVVDVNREMLDDLVRKWKEHGVRWPGRKEKRVRPLTNANGYIRTLSAGFGLAKMKWGLITGLTFPIEPDRKRGKYMSPDVFGKICAQLPTQDIRDVFELAYLNGIRKGQLRSTEVSNVIIKRVAGKERWEITWRGDQTKAGKKDGQPHTLPLVGRSLEIVRRAYTENRREHCPFLWHSIKCGRWSRRHHAGDPCIGRFQSEWDRASEAAGVPAGWKRGGFVFHFSRNAAVTNLNGAGIPDTVAMTITGHRTLAVYKRYGIRQESVQRAAMEKVEEYVHGLSTDDQKPKRQAS